MLYRKRKFVFPPLILHIFASHIRFIGTLILWIVIILYIQIQTRRISSGKISKNKNKNIFSNRKLYIMTLAKIPLSNRQKLHRKIYWALSAIDAAIKSTQQYVCKIYYLKLKAGAIRLKCLKKIKITSSTRCIQNACKWPILILHIYSHNKTVWIIVII